MMMQEKCYTMVVKLVVSYVRLHEKKGENTHLGVLTARWRQSSETARPTSSHSKRKSPRVSSLWTSVSRKALSTEMAALITGWFRMLLG